MNNLNSSVTTIFVGLLLVLLASACGNTTSNDSAASSTTTEPIPSADGGATLLGKLNESIQQNPLDGDLYFKRASVFYEKEQYDEAIADIYLDYYKSRQALLTMERAAKLHPERIPTLLKLAEFQLILKQHQESFKTIDKILKLDPQNAEAYFMMGLNFRELNDSARAINALQTAVENDADLKDAWVMLGDLFSAQENPIALRYYDNAIRLDSTNIDYIYAKATYLHSTGVLDEATELYQKTLRFDPQFSDAYYNIGLVFMEQDSIANAAKHFDMATQTDPLFVMAYFYRGLAAEQMGNPTVAKQNYEQVLTLKPDFQRARDALAGLK